MKLDPVRDALLADARRDADDVRTAADRDASVTLATASAEAERLVAAARAAGEAEARSVAATELAHARRQSREVVLRARREVYDRARVAARNAASTLREAHRYDALLDALTRVASEQLGDGATVTVDDQVGGLVARAGSRTVDYRLPSIADRCFTDLGPGVETLWR